MADNKLGLKMLFELCEKVESGKIDIIDFLKEGDIIICNKLSSRCVSNFSDGWSKGCSSNILSYALRAFRGDEKALSRLEVDLEIVEYNIEVVRCEV